MSFLPLRQKLGRLKRDCNEMGQLMAALIKYADSDSTKDPESDDERQGREKRTATPRVSSITRQIRGAMVNAKLMVTRSLWLTPMHREIINVARGGHLLGLVDLVLLLSSC